MARVAVLGPETAENLFGGKNPVGEAVKVKGINFSAVVGIFFGYYPSRRAALLDPIEALRYE